MQRKKVVLEVDFGILSYIKPSYSVVNVYFNHSLLKIKISAKEITKMEFRWQNKNF